MKVLISIGIFIAAISVATRICIGRKWKSLHQSLYLSGVSEEFKITKLADEKRVRVKDTMNDKQMILVKKNSTDEYDLTPFTNHTQSYKIDIENLHGTLVLGDGRRIQDYEKKQKRARSEPPRDRSREEHPPILQRSSTNWEQRGNEGPFIDHHPSNSFQSFDPTMGNNFNGWNEGHPPNYPERSRPVDYQAAPPQFSGNNHAGMGGPHWTSNNNQAFGRPPPHQPPVEFHVAPQQTPLQYNSAPPQPSENYHAGYGNWANNNQAYGRPPPPQPTVAYHPPGPAAPHQPPLHSAPLQSAGLGFNNNQAFGGLPPQAQQPGNPINGNGAPYIDHRRSDTFPNSGNRWDEGSTQFPMKRSSSESYQRSGQPANSIYDFGKENEDWSAQGYSPNERPGNIAGATGKTYIPYRPPGAPENFVAPMKNDRWNDENSRYDLQ